MTGPAAGPWVVVAGMHRSGTSAMGRLCSGLGLQGVRGDDAVEWAASNPDHAESLTLTTFDDDVLRARGGSWDAPPEPADLPAEVLDRGRAVDALDRAFPRPGPTVWKDPRLCLLLPAWRRVLAGPLAVVLVWRAPGAVAASLASRDGLPGPDALALWERYNREVVRHTAGLPVHVVPYEHLVAEPASVAGALATWLDGLDGRFRPPAGWDPQAAAGEVAPDLDHAPGGPAGDLLPEQAALLETLAGSAGTHDAFDPGPVGPESPWTTALLRYRRERSEPLALLAEARHELDLERAALAEARRRLEDVYTSTVWRVTGPLRALLGFGRRSSPAGVSDPSPPRPPS